MFQADSQAQAGRHMAGSVKSEGGEGVKVNNKKKKQKKKKWNDDWSFRMNFERSKW